MPRPARLLDAAAISTAAIAALIVVVAGACAHDERRAAPPPLAAVPAGEVPAATPVDGSKQPQPPASSRLARIRWDVDEFLERQAVVLWEAWTRGSPADLGPSAEQYASAFSSDTLAFVRDEREHAAGEERRALSLLHGFLVGEYLARVAGPPPDAPTLTWNGRSIPPARVLAHLAGEPSASRRAALARAWADAERRGASSADSHWSAIANAARKLGYPNLLALATELRDRSPDALESMSRRVLEVTDGEYRATMGALAMEELQKPLAELRGGDLPRLFEAGEDRHLFPGARAAPDAYAVFAALGLDVVGRPGILLDGETRPGKDARALTLPVAVPGDVRVAYAVADGPAELEALLHELGAAAFYAHVGTAEMEFRRLGAVTVETWADLFAQLMGDPAWVAERTGAVTGRLARVVRAANARRLHRARILAARVIEEIARAREPSAAVATSRARLERAMLRPVDGDELDLFRLDRDPLLESADALQSLLLAARAEIFLAARASTPWWRSREAGAWLAAAFAEGSRSSPTELARSLGAEDVDPAPLAASVGARLDAASVPVTSAR